MRRGHTLLHGVCTIIGANTDKILDVEALSSFFYGYNNWKGPKTGQNYKKTGFMSITEVETIMVKLEIWMLKE